MMGRQSRQMAMIFVDMESLLWKALHNKDNEKKYKMKSHLQKD